MKKILSVMLCALLLTTFAAACAPKADSLSKIEEAGKLVMLTNAEFAPYEYLGANGEIAGIDVDICQAIADDLGVQLEVVNMDFDGLIAAMKSGKGDLVAAGMTVDAERQQNADFSVTYADATQIIIVNKTDPKVTTEADLAGKSIGVQLGTTGDLYVSEEIEGADVRQFKSGLEAAQDLLNGRLDAVVLDILPAQGIVDNNSDDLALLEMTSTSEQYAIALPKGDTAFVERVNSVLEKLIADGKVAEFTAAHVEATRGA